MPASEVDKEIKSLIKEVKEFLPPVKEFLAAAKKKAPKKIEATLAEWVRSTLAVFIVIFLLAIFGVIWIFFGIEDVARAATFLLPLVTLVLGYYFGKEGKKAAQEQAAIAGEERKSAEVREQKEKAAKVDSKKADLANLLERRKSLKSKQGKLREKIDRLEEEAGISQKKKPPEV